MTTRLSQNRTLLCAAFVFAAACGPADPTDAGVDAGEREDAARASCERDSDCADALYCNGAERCAPGDSDADAMGCVAGANPCGATEECVEASQGCQPADCDEPDRDGDNRDRIACGGDDCDDDDVNRFPGNTEVCDAEGHDEDCQADTFGGTDEDGDGFVSHACCNGEDCGRDCDDTRRDVHPDAVEACNAVDDDCDGAIDGTDAFCPAGMCVDQRCRGASWERVFTHGPALRHVETSFLAVDDAGHSYLHLHITSPVDLDRDGTDEVAGNYLISFAADGRVRWLSAPLSANGSLGQLSLLGSFALDPNEPRIAYSSRESIVLISSENGQETSRIADPPPAEGREDQSSPPRVVAFSGSDLVLQYFYSGLGPPPSGFDFDHEVVLMTTGGTVLQRRLFDTPGRGLGLEIVEATDSQLTVSGHATPPYEFEPGVVAEGAYTLTLDRGLRAASAINNLPGPVVDTSDTGSLLVAGTAQEGYQPFWGGDPWDLTVAGEMCNVSDGGFALRLSAEGDYLWHRLHTSTDCDEFVFAGFDGRGGVAIAGTFSGEMDVEPQGRLVAEGQQEAFYLVADEADGGRLVRDAHRFPSTGPTRLRAAAADRFGGLILVGQFSTGDITLPSGTTYTTGDQTDLFIVRVSDLP